MPKVIAKVSSGPEAVVVFDPRGASTRQVLAEMGEWMALGFYEGIDLPWPRAFGLAFRRFYENIPIRLHPEHLLLPSEPFPIEPSLERRPGQESWYWGLEKAHHATGFLCDFMHHCGIHLNGELVEDRKRRYPQHAAFIDAFMSDLRSRTPHFGGYTHSNPDIRRVVTEGFIAIEAELDEQIAAATAPDETNLLAALKDYAAGVRAFHGRAAAAIAAAAASRPELRLIADSFAHGFLHPARTFVEGLLAVHFAWLLDGCDSIGRPDQVLGELFERDLDSGTLDLALAGRLIDELWSDFERFDAWNLQVGGYRPDGADGCNRLTREMIEACRRKKFRRPNVALRITSHTPDEVLQQAISVLADGSGRPALYNDDLYIRTLLDMDLGLTPEDAREMGFGGCTETMIAGLSNVGSLEGRLNLAKAMELALHDGCDPATGQQAGPHTGSLAAFASFDEFVNAVKRQVRYMTDAFVSANRRDLQRRFTEGDPKLYRTLFTRDCVARRKSFEAGGARYNWAVVSYYGIANMIDSLAAVRKCVFEDRSIRPDELLAAMKANFAGYDAMHARLAAAPKFGNDDPYVDEPGADVVRDAWEELYSHQTPRGSRGGRYVASCILFTTYHEGGKKVGALPDGRKAGTPLADSTGPYAGRDTHGPTAMLRSVARLPLHLAIGTPIVNIRVQKHVLRDPDGLAAFVRLVRGYFALGGLQLQISAISKEDMLAAQKDPQRYRDLIVRIGGFSEYFTRLSPALQESVIARTEYG